MYVEGNKGKKDRITQLLQNQIIEIENKYNGEKITAEEAVGKLSAIAPYISDTSATNMITKIQNNAYTKLYGPNVIGTWKADDIKKRT